MPGPTRWRAAALAAAALCGCVQGGSGDDAGQLERCQLAPDPGDCNAAFEAYAFDAASQRCLPFTWGGCDGVVPFSALSECQGACEPCEAFFAASTPAPTHAAAEISVRNDSAQAIYLRAYTPGGGAVGFRAETVAIVPLGTSKPLITAPNECDFPCALYDNPECGNACSDSGLPPGPILLQPGATYKAAWSGLHFAAVTLPDRCLPAACEPGQTCGRWLNATPGDYSALVVVSPSWECADPMTCTCTPNADGWCQVDGFAAQGGPTDPIPLATTLTFPGGPVELVFS